MSLVNLAQRSTSSKVIDLFQYHKQAETLDLDWLLERLIGNESFQDYLKDVIEGIIYNLWIDRKVKTEVALEDPFDAVFIADLKPDVIEPDAFLVSMLAKRIEDRSDQIFIDDGWDD